jgi:hypothetical protein
VPVEPTLLRLLNSDRHSDWQKLWLAHTAGALGTVTSDEIIEWLNNRVRNGSPVLAAYSAVALGQLGQGDPTALKQALDRVTPEYHLPILWTLGKLDPNTARDITGSRLARLVLQQGQA